MLLGQRKDLHHEPPEMTVRPVPVTTATVSVYRVAGGSIRVLLKAVGSPTGAEHNSHSG